ncbi:hypothetical protein [Bradyrhizobium liaoningense]|uniref:hypothetical protein n=1 Tax=Bradyrhizobium liaoningense TaxID=43992 RepID=UPI003D9B7A94
MSAVRTRCVHVGMQADGARTTLSRPQHRAVRIVDVPPASPKTDSLTISTVARCVPPASEFLRMVLELGAARCLRKPFTPRALLAAVNDGPAEHPSRGRHCRGRAHGLARHRLGGHGVTVRLPQSLHLPIAAKHG